MATDSDRSAPDTWAPDAVAERTTHYFRNKVGLESNQWLTDVVALGRIVEVDDTGKVTGSYIARLYPGGSVAGDIERMMLTEAHDDALAERAERRSRN